MPWRWMGRHCFKYHQVLADPSQNICRNWQSDRFSLKQNWTIRAGHHIRKLNVLTMGQRTAPATKVNVLNLKWSMNHSFMISLNCSAQSFRPSICRLPQCRAQTVANRTNTGCLKIKTCSVFVTEFQSLVLKSGLTRIGFHWTLRGTKLR
jgi:hypothetical protein